MCVVTHQDCSHLLLYHAEFLVHCLEVISVEAWSVKQGLEVPEGDPAHRPGDARHEGGHGAGSEVHYLGRHTRGAWHYKIGVNFYPFQGVLEKGRNWL